MTIYPCPRSDLACTERFPSTGDLDYHLHVTHGYRSIWRIASSLRPEHRMPVGPRPARHVPDGLVEGQGTLTLSERASTLQLERAPDTGIRTDGGPADAGALTGIRPSATVAAGHRRRRRHVRISR
ncbi:hypothetical protein [Candidatus Frankia alpina]|uniref:Uncharacterized protein n=1 Tax=Candidatus Frankia alpina TaxID=2699483 RepID=A0A4V3Z7H5_9ACTN|nr:hypothetical protein [Candidatus Frankia alpina]THJ74209.1 hypothetical protein E7Y31_12815 [Candidatus Frankia alpina]